MPASAGTPATSFDRLIESWHTLTYVLNNLNRGLGLADAYPFVLSPMAVDKLRFVHDAVAAAAAKKRKRSHDAEPARRLARRRPHHGDVVFEPRAASIDTNSGASSSSTRILAWRVTGRSV